LSQESLDSFALTEDAQKKIQEYLKDICTAFEYAPEKAFDIMKASMLFELTTLKESFEGMLGTSDPAKQKGLTQQCNSLGSLIEDIHNANDIQGLFTALVSKRLSKRELSAIAPLVRQLCFHEVMKSQEVPSEIVQQRAANITYQMLPQLLDFIDHEILQEWSSKVSPSIGFDKKAFTGFLKSCIATNIFSDELDRFNAAKTFSGEEIFVHPNRSLLGEASGYIANACWSRQHDILKNNPTIVPLIFSKGSVEVGLKLLGATLLIPATVEATNERVVVIRGLNPAQNYLNDTDVGSFVESLIDYIESWAKDAGFSSILVVGDGCSRAQTNRPQISTYLMNTYVHGKKPVPLVQESALLFNGYDIAADKCFVARKLGVNQAEEPAELLVGNL
jgi:hypothetical protein